MTASYRDQARQYGPYAAMYALGLLTYWALSAVFGGPGGEITATTYVSEGVSRHIATRPSAGRGDDSALSTRLVYAQQPTAEDLIDAARDGDLHSVRRLIYQRVDVNATDSYGRTALMMAAAAGEAGVAAVLLDAGAKLNVQSADGETPLMNAAMKGDAETVALLIEHKANVTAKDKEGATAHDHAIRNKHDTIARLIADEIDRQNRDRIMITRAQFLLAKLGYRPGGIDGHLGPKTQDAIERFQRDQDLTPSGVVTEALLVALNERQQAVEETRKTTRTARRRSPSERALRNASARKPIRPAAESAEPEGEGFFSRAGRWLEENAIPDLDSSDTESD